MAINIQQLLALLQQQPTGQAQQQGSPPQDPIQQPAPAPNKVRNPFLGVHGDKAPSPTMEPFSGLPLAPGHVAPSKDPLEGNPFIPYGRGGKPQPKENLGGQVLGGVGDLFSGMKIPGAFEQSKQSTKPKVMSSNAPPSGPVVDAESPDFVGPQTPPEPEAAQFAYPGQEHDLIQSAAQEVSQRGAQNPDQADDIIRMEFQDDPEIEGAIAHARQRYAIAQARSARPPGVMEYVGYVLSTLAGANPMQAAEAISRRGEKRQDEQMALQDLLGAQGMKVRDRQMQRQMGAEQMSDLQRLMQKQQEGDQRAGERAEDKNFDRLKAGRGAALQRMNQLQQAVNMSNNPAEKKALQEELNTLKRRTQFFGRQLGEPEKDEQGRPIGVASPDAMRLLGLG
jgi:hypothetical protein